MLCEPMFAFKIWSIAILTGVHTMAKEVWHHNKGKINRKGANAVRDAWIERCDSGKRVTKCLSGRFVRFKLIICRRLRGCKRYCYISQACCDFREKTCHLAEIARWCLVTQRFIIIGNNWSILRRLPLLKTYCSFSFHHLPLCHTHSDLMHWDLHIPQWEC